MDRLSQFFTKTMREDPQGEEAINAKLLIKAGFIVKQMAGVYTLLSLGFKVIEKINKIIREELNAIGAQEIAMPAFQPKELWDKTGRWKTANDVMYQFKDNSGKDIGLGWTHEEVITQIATHFIQSYKDLPKAIYQIQTKFRDEPRAKSGILRGREFLMKDLYSFHVDEKDRDDYYEKIKDVYQKIFKRIGIKAILTFASGGTFSKYSHEFQTIADNGEDTIWLCNNCQIAINNEIIEEHGKKCKECDKELEKQNAIEVGNIFKLGTKFSQALELSINNKDGKKIPVEMASFGIGPTRIMGAIVEVNHDENGIIWGKNVAPYNAHIIEIRNPKFEIRNKSKTQNIKSKTQEIVDQLENAGLEVLVDDREDVSIGEKLADADLIGIPWRVVISEKTLAQDGVEIKKRDSEKAEIVDVNEALSIMKK